MCRILSIRSGASVPPVDIIKFDREGVCPRDRFRLNAIDMPYPVDDIGMGGPSYRADSRPSNENSMYPIPLVSQPIRSCDDLRCEPSTTSPCAPGLAHPGRFPLVAGKQVLRGILTLAQPGRHRVRGKGLSPPGALFGPLFSAVNSFPPEQADTGRSGRSREGDQERSSL